MKKTGIVILLFSVITGTAQVKDKGNRTFSSGVISFGARNTASLFNDQGSKTGFGMGGQFRIQFADHVNSDWFADYITSQVGNYANRTDYHIGWSVLFYPGPLKEDQPFLKPYILAGHCFDYTRITDNSNKNNYGQRWSSAVQAGLGTHFNFTERFDLSLTGQYMIHIGNEINSDVVNDIVTFRKEKGTSLEGHLLITLSMNYKIADLW